MRAASTPWRPLRRLVGSLAISIPLVVVAQEPSRVSPAVANRSPVMLGSPQELAGEVSLLRIQVDELRRLDAEKDRKLDELQRQLEAIQAGPSLGRFVAQDNPPQDKPAGQQESALDKAIRELEQSAPSGQSALDKAVQGVAPAPAQQPVASVPVGGARLQLLDISLDGLFAVGTSTETEPSIQQLEGGDHDPHRRGFTVQNIELFLAGAVDPYLDA